MITELFTHFSIVRSSRFISICLLLLCGVACDNEYVVDDYPLIETEEIIYGDPAEMTRTPLSLEARRDGYIRIINPLQTEIYYTINGSAATSNNKLKVLIIVKAGDVVQLYANANTYKDAHIECSSPFYVYGNIMSLISADGFESIEEIPEESTFRYLFDRNTYIYNHPEKELILSATVMKPFCYFAMFRGCTSLVVAPKLPATTLASSCYSSMFAGCSGLISAPSLPATQLEPSCYSSMFSSCTSLTEPPRLPATTLAEACYSEMFKGCRNLISPPELPAKTLANLCYSSMFYDCRSIKTAPVLPATILARGCYSSMFADCSGLISAPSLPATQLEPSCYSSMFSSCASLTEAPELPARELVSNCYTNMFSDCSKLSHIKALFVTAPGKDYTLYWVRNVAESGVFVKSSDASWDEHGDNGIPEGWTVK